MGRWTLPDTLPDLPPVEPTSRRERWRAGLYLASVGALVVLIVLAVAFDQLAATGVLVIGFLSFVLAYLMAPAVERLRYAAAPSRGRPLSRGFAVLALYGLVAVATFPVWAFTGERVGAAMGRMRVFVPQYTARFVRQLHASEKWHATLHLPAPIDDVIGRTTRRVTSGLEAEARELGAELVGVRRLVPWLSVVPVAAFLLLTRWRRFRRSTTRVLPTPHLQWRGDEFLRNLNGILAAYTRAQAVAAVFVAVLCWVGFAVLHVPYPGTLAISAGLLEMVPVAGPLVMAVVASAMMPARAVQVLVFLAGLRLVQDYVIYPRLIRRAMHLHPIGVVIALWAGAALGGIVGVCLAVPVVGAVQVTRRHWREYRDIENLVRDTAAMRVDRTAGSAGAGAPPAEPREER